MVPGAAAVATRNYRRFGDQVDIGDELDDIVPIDEAAAVKVEICLIALDFLRGHVLEQG